MPDRLTAEERETVIVMSDASDVAQITTYQKPTITKLRKNPAARLVEEHPVGTSAGATFELPRSLISFRSKPGRKTAGNPEVLRRHQEERRNADS